jgi:hypothetical protein
MRTACATGALSPLLIPDEAADDRSNDHNENKADEDGTDVCGYPCEHIDRLLSDEIFFRITSLP